MRKKYCDKKVFSVFLALLMMMSFSFLGNPVVYADDTGSLTVTKETTDADNAPDDEFTFKVRVWHETTSTIYHGNFWGTTANRLYPGFIRLTTNEEIEWIIDGTPFKAKGLGYEPHYDQDPTTGNYNYASGYLDIYELKSDFEPRNARDEIPVASKGTLLARIYFDDFIFGQNSDRSDRFYNFITNHVAVKGYVNFEETEIPIFRGSTNTYISGISFLDLSDAGDSFRPIEDDYYTTKLKQGESFTISNIPDGSRYTIEEIDFPEDWEYTSIPDNTTGKISAGATTAVTYSNRYVAKDVILEKTWDDDNNPNRPTDLTGFISIAENEAGTPEYVDNGDPAVNYNKIADISLERNEVIISNNLAHYTVDNMDYEYWETIFDDWRVITEDNYGPYLFRRTDMTIKRAGVEYPVYVYVSDYISLCLVSLDDYPMPGQQLMVSGEDWTKDGNTWTATVKLPIWAEAGDWGEADVPENYEFEKGESEDNVYKMKNTLTKKDEDNSGDSDNGDNDSGNGDSGNGDNGSGSSDSDNRDNSSGNSGSDNGGSSSNNGSGNGDSDNGNNGSNNVGSSDQGDSNANDSKDSPSQNPHSGNDQNRTSVKTGDDSQQVMYGFLFMLSLILFLGLLETRRHSKM